MNRLLQKLSALLLVFVLVVPNPAFDRGNQVLVAGNGAAFDSRSHALRDPSIREKEPKVLAGLEQALRSDEPNDLIQLASTSLGLPITSLVPTPPIVPVSAGLEESSKTGFELSPTPDQAVIEGNRRYLESKGWKDRLSALFYDRPFILEDRKLQATLEQAIRQQEAQLMAMKHFRHLAGPLAELLGMKPGSLPGDAETSPERSVADNLLSFAHFLQALHFSAVGQDVESAIAYQAARETAQDGGLMMMFRTGAFSDAFYILGRFYLDGGIDVPRAGYALRRGLASFDMEQESQFLPEDFSIKLGAIDLLTNPKKTGIQIIGDLLTATHGYASHTFQILASGDNEVAQGLRAHFAEVKKQTLAASALVNHSGTGIVLGAGRFVVFPLVELLRERLPDGALKYNKLLLLELGADISRRELQRMVEAGEITAEEASRVEILAVDATGILKGVTGYIDKAMADAFQQKPRKVPLDRLTKLYQALADPQLINRLILPGQELMVPENSVNLAVFAMAIQDFASPIRKYIDTWLELFPVDRETKEALEKLDGYSSLIQKNITAVILRRLSREVMSDGVVFLGDTTGMVSGKEGEQKKIGFYDVDSLSSLVPQGLPFEAANSTSWLRPNNAGKPDLFFLVESLALKKIESAASTATAGVEEVQGGAIVNEATFRELVKSSAVQRDIGKQGYAEITSEQAAAVSVPETIGGFIMADSAEVDDAGHLIVAESGLVNEAAASLFPWVFAGDGLSSVIDSAKGAEAQAGDLMLLKPAQGISAGSITAALRERGFTENNAPRVAVGDVGKISALSPFTFQLLAVQKGLPPVVFLNVAVRLKDEAGNTYTLLLMA